MRQLFATIALLLAMVLPAVAGPFENANNFIRAETGIADFTLDPTEFGPNNFIRVAHLTIEIIGGWHNGYVVVYNAAQPAKPIFVDAGNGYSEPTQTQAMWDQCGPGSWFMYNVGGAIWCVPAHLVGKSGGSTYIGDTEPIDRNCRVKVNGAHHDHSC